MSNMEFLEDLIKAQDKEIQRIQNKNELELQKLTTEQAKERMELVGNELDKLYEKAKTTGMTPEILAELQQCGDKYLIEVAQYEVQVYSYNSMLKEHGIKDNNKNISPENDSLNVNEVKEITRNKSPEFKNTIKVMVAQIYESYNKKRIACIAAASQTKDVLVDAIKKASKISKDKMEEFSDLTANKVRSINRAYQNSIIKKDQELIANIIVKKEKCLQLAEVPYTTLNRIQNAGRVLVGKEPIHKEQTEHKKISDLFDRLKKPLAQEIAKKNKSIQESLKKSVATIKKYPDLYKQLEAAYNNSQPERTSSLNKKIKNAERIQKQSGIEKMSEQMHKHDIEL